MPNQLRRILSPLLHSLLTVQLVWSACRNWTIAWMILLLIQGILPAVTVYLTRSVVDGLVAIAGAGTSWSVIQPMIMPALLMGGALLLGEVVQALLQWVRTAQSEFVKDHISALVHQKSTAVDLAFYEASDFYDHLAQAQEDAAGRSLSLLESSGSLIQSLITLIALIGLLIPYGLGLPIVLVASTLPAFYVILKLNKRQHRWWERTTTERRRLQYYEILITLSNTAAEVRLFNLGSYFQQAYQRSRKRLRKEQIDLAQEQSIGRLLAGMMALLIAAGAIAWMGWRVLLGTITLGDLALFYQAFSRVQTLIQALLGSLGQIYRNGLFMGNLAEFLKLESQLAEPACPVAFPQPLQTGIQFRNITFRYPGSDRAVLENFNLTLPAGKIVAIVGDNGAGKSTLTKLLCRFYDPEAGSITIDGIDLRQFATSDLRRNITMLFQDPVPYYLPAGENIRLGDLSRVATPDAIEESARAAGIHDAISQLPQGYESLMGKWFPGGTELSGGQWQRLALARSFYRQAPVIILDEPTSAMDPWAEHDWLERFRTMAADRTALVITHRFTLAMQADVIHVMRDGYIVESGHHDQLLLQNGLYAESWKSQMQSAAESPDPHLV